MSTPILYRSSDASAPVLTGTAGDLVNLLTKCLTAGYGSQSSAGWTLKSGFAGNTSTRAVIQQPAGNGFYLDIDDRGASGILTGTTGREAAIRGYEAMTDVSTGTNPFPTTAQIAANTANWRKSTSADSTPRGWFLIADDRTFTLGILDGDVANAYKLYYFGDFYSIKSGDGFRTSITVRSVVNTSLSTGCLLNAPSTSLTNPTAGTYAPRIAAGTGTSLNICLTGLIGGNSSLDSSGTWPTLDGNIYLSRVIIGDTSTNVSSLIRGWMRGVYMIFQVVGLNDGDTFTGTGDFAGRSFVVCKGAVNLAIAVALETTAWDTSS